MLSLTPIFTVILFLTTTVRVVRADNRRSSSESFYWSALITPKFNTTGEWNCSGAYIGQRDVITSGVCVQGYSEFRIALGAYTARFPESNVTTVQFKYEFIIDSLSGSKHDSSDKRLTILKLENDPTVSFGAYIQPLTLPPEPTINTLNDALNTYNNHALLLVWDQSKDGDLSQPTLDVDVLIYLSCVTLRPEIDVHKEFCAAGQKIDGKYQHLCPRIGFGPLLVTGYNTLIGIGIDNCVEDKPQTFLRINGYRKWIDEVQWHVKRAT